MLGKDHALSGLGAGLLAGLVLHKTRAGTAELGGFTAGMALLPDLDSCGSSPARSLGFISSAVSHAVRLLSGGHRHATHSLVGAAAFTGLAVLGGVLRHHYAGMVILGLLVMLTVSAAAECTGLLDGHTADLAGAGVAAAVVAAGFGLALIPLAAGLGCLTHCLGDSLTDSGVNWLWPFSMRRLHIPEPWAFSTGTLPETRLVRPALCGAAAALTLLAADPGAAGQAIHWLHAR